QAQLALELEHMNIQSVQLDQSSTNAQIEKIQNQISDFQNQKKSGVSSSDQMATKSVNLSTANLNQLQSLLVLKKQQLTLLNQRSQLLQQKLELSQKWLDILQAIMKQKQQVLRHESLLELEHKLQQDIQEKQNIINNLQLQLQKNKLNTPASRKHQVQLTQQIHFLNESINLLNTKLKLATENSELEGIDISHPEKYTAAQLKQWLTKITEIRQQLDSTSALNKANLNILLQELELLKKRFKLQEIDADFFHNEQVHLQDLISAFQEQLQNLNNLKSVLNTKLVALQKAYQFNLNRSLTLRQHLPDKREQWLALASELGHIPYLLFETLNSTWHDFVTKWHNSDIKKLITFFLFFTFIIGLSLSLSRLPKPALGTLADNQTFTMKTRSIFYALLRSSRSVFIIAAPLLSAIWIFNLQSGRLILMLLAIWLVFQWLVQISYWLLISPLVPVDLRQPRLHRNLLWVMAGSAFITVFVGMGQLGLLSETMQVLFDQIFMLLMLPLAVLTLQLRKKLIQHSQTDSNNSFWKGLVSLLSLIFPLTILALSIIGLAGYVNLAWFIAQQLLVVVMVLVIWMILRHLMLDGIAHLKLLAQSSSKQTGYLIRGIINPLQLLFTFALLLSMTWLLIYFLTWSSGVDIEEFLKNILSSPIFTIGNKTIEPLHLIQAGLIAFFVIYFGIWIRQLSYELFYRKIHDRGLRNSLSVFTQYFIIIIGLLLALNLLGINLTSLTVFAGALGVGIGFGLQNIANNFISGLILLTERPVRTEDWISIGNQEGRIKHIGMRSLVLTAWDNQDVIIPNADLITSSVTNWTLSDSLIRTVFEVGIRYQDDPHQAKKVIEKAVAMTPSVYLEREPQVLLTEFANSSVNFRVQFYSDVDNQTSRIQVKSDVMFAIWDALKEAGIGIPFPQQDIYIKELPDSKSTN
ncbi:MAG TPA: mechanosensitive ion channel, partial [Gammaproteobacteria bacterium]|nr:mechanosensitive ion channel [Gammaproteobacteria bacterium]